MAASESMGLGPEVEEAATHLRKMFPYRVRTGVVLGSGLGLVRRGFETVRAVPYSAIPNLPVSTVHGHRGELVLAKRDSRRLLIMDGRVHRYEGYSLGQVTLPIMVMRRLGVTTLIVTNAAGGISRHLRPGDIMLIQDHINLLWSALPGVSRRPRVLHRPYYSDRLIKTALRIGIARGIPVKTGVLLATTGPSYETPSEVELARKIGADAVTMSTIPEATVCRELGMAVLGMSLVTNMAASHGGGHDTVVAFARRAGRDLRTLVLGVIDAVEGECRTGSRDELV